MLRTEKGLTLARVGEGSDNEGNLKGHLSNIEHGRVSLTVMMLEKIAKKIEVELPYLTTIPDASKRQALIERTRWMTDDEVRTLRRRARPRAAASGIGPNSAKAAAATSSQQNPQSMMF